MTDWIGAEVTRLRQVRRAILSPMPASAIVDALDALGKCLGAALEPASAGPLAASLRTLLAAELTPEATKAGILAFSRSILREPMWHLLEEELGHPEVLDTFQRRPFGGQTRATSPAVTACFLAGNTPLLAWPVLTANLLVKSATFAKLPAEERGWAALYRDALREVAPGLDTSIGFGSWPGTARECNARLCQMADAVAVFGSDAACVSLRELTPVRTPFFAYGHRLSIAVLLEDGVSPSTAEGIARDVLAYDQGGCLSVTMAFVEGTPNEAVRAGDTLARALERLAALWGLGPRDPEARARVQAARSAALFAPEARVWGDPGCRWSVILSPGVPPQVHGGEGVLLLYPYETVEDFVHLLQPLADYIQGAAIAGPQARARAVAECLAELGVSRVCIPGRLQEPPFRWHHNGSSVLRHLLRWTDLEIE